MAKFVVNPALFSTALLFTSTEKTRLYLRGVYLQPAKGGGVLITASDGAALFRAHDPEGAASAAALVRVPKGRLPPTMLNGRGGSLWIDTEDGTIRQQMGAKEIAACETVDGAFPDVERVVPREVSGEVAASFPIVQTERLCAAARRLAEGSMFPRAYRVLHNGAGPALVTFDTPLACFAVVMPARPTAPDAVPTLPTAAT